jgi:hypothetical protein
MHRAVALLGASLSLVLAVSSCTGAANGAPQETEQVNPQNQAYDQSIVNQLYATWISAPSNDRVSGFVCTLSYTFSPNQLEIVDSCKSNADGSIVQAVADAPISDVQQKTFLVTADVTQTTNGITAEARPGEYTFQVLNDSLNLMLPDGTRLSLRRSN